MQLNFYVSRDLQINNARSLFGGCTAVSCTEAK